MSTVSDLDIDLDWRPSRQELLAAALVLNAEVLVVLVYLAVEPVTVQSWRYIVYAFLWINAGLLAIARTTPAPTDVRTRRLALAVATGYFLVLAAAGGLVGPSHTSPLASLFTDGHLHSHGPVETGLSVRMLPPGWGPALVYQGAWLTLILMPYKLVGYLALAYLVYATVIDAAGAAVPGVVGLLSCISCTWPVVGSLVTSLFGSGSVLAVAATTWPYDISTAAYLAAVALLAWRPIARGR